LNSRVPRVGLALSAGWTRGVCDLLATADRDQLPVAQRRQLDTWVGFVSEVDGSEPLTAVRFRGHAVLNIVTGLARSRGASVVAASLHNR
jgi:hypothetical protein